MRDELSKLILYRGFCDAPEGDALPAYLVALAERYGFGGNLWQAYVCFALLGHENPWSLACEGRGEPSGSLAPLAGKSAPLSSLVGYDTQKAKLRANTEAFLAGRSANNVLLYGDAGTGKSTCVRALLAEYPDSLLRVIELPKDRLSVLPQLADALGRRRCRFLLFLDDLSFEEDETAYKQLKAAIEGGLASLPENVRIYATSNRRHLVRETWKDRADMEHDEDIHRSDTMEEKLSLSARFGLRIYFPSPTFQEYHAIVEELARRRGADGAALRQAASAWQVRQGSRSGRTAKQFVDDCLGRQDGQPAAGAKKIDNDRKCGYYSNVKKSII